VLNKVQKNAIFHVLTHAGLEPAEFELSTRENRSVITHGPSGSQFSVDSSQYDSHQHRFHPIEQNIAAGITEELSAYSWEAVTEYIRRWARDVHEELEGPDLWAELRRERGIVAQLQREGVSNAPFTEDERAEISGQLQEITKAIKKNYSLTSEQMASIEQRLSESIRASERVGRKDWLLMFTGTAFNLIVTDIVPPSIVRNILTMALHGLAHLFGVGGSPPQLPPLA